ncbi:MAG: pentapeptide repeat-containing protein, partial [Acidimicrobiia bacterium]
DLSQSNLSGADLSDARLDFADMSGCDMRGVDLSGASLVETSLWNADLRGADLSRCKNIVMANLRRARYDRSTRWPAGFDPSSQGAVSDSQAGRR